MLSCDMFLKVSLMWRLKACMGGHLIIDFDLVIYLKKTPLLEYMLPLKILAELICAR
jgi:hypothetical protein